MDRLKEYNIPFVGLKLGSHDFEFTIEKTFFELFDHSEDLDGKVNVKLLLNKKESMLTLDFTINGHLTVPCDRCLETIKVPVSSEDRIFVKFSEEEESGSEEVVVLSPNEYQINIASIIYELIYVQLPARNVHPEGKCDPEVIKKLEELNVKETRNDIDPRWESLYHLKDKNELN